MRTRTHTYTLTHSHAREHICMWHPTLDTFTYTLRGAGLKLPSSTADTNPPFCHPHYTSPRQSTFATTLCTRRASSAWHGVSSVATSSHRAGSSSTARWRVSWARHRAQPTGQPTGQPQWRGGNDEGSISVVPFYYTQSRARKGEGVSYKLHVYVLKLVCNG